jgi:hypothetical protein
MDFMPPLAKLKSAAPPVVTEPDGKAFFITIIGRYL